MVSGVWSLMELEEAIATHPNRWRPLVFTNGCFDLIHVGHIQYLHAAKSQGRSLVVGLNSDRSVQTIKPQQPGFPSRPIVPQQQRAEVLAALKPVDAVIIFHETTATSANKPAQTRYLRQRGRLYSGNITRSTRSISLWW